MARQVRIGHTVLVRHSDVKSNGSDLAPAIVTRVWNSGEEKEMINVTAFPDFGGPKLLGSLPRIDSSSIDKTGWFFDEAD